MMEQEQESNCDMDQVKHEQVVQLIQMLAGLALNRNRITKILQ
jgi:hypothetical protein